MKRTGRKELSKTMAVRDFTHLKKLVNEHQMKEEQILIPIVDRYLDTKASESIRREHKELAQTLLQLNVKLNRINCSNEARRALVKSITEFNLIARKHFSREENVIYWYARLCLSQPHDSTRV
jgi:hemerythrin-like domain-containing protein